MGQVLSSLRTYVQYWLWNEWPEIYSQRTDKKSDAKKHIKLDTKKDFRPLEQFDLEGLDAADVGALKSRRDVSYLPKLNLTMLNL